MLDNFREIYNQELANLCPVSTLEHLILSSLEVRAFVYEVCKTCVFQPDTKGQDEKII